MADELIPTLELPASARAASRFRSAYRRFSYEARHPENHRQLVRFLCVGASGYVVNTLSFWIFIHPIALDYRLSFVAAFLCGSANNFVWNRHWTFKANHEGAARQAVRFILVQTTVAACAYGVMLGLVASTNIWKVPADALAWIIVTPVSFLVQKLWSFKA
ncbi:MAG: GtrA family protein [Actinomycetota bacterium]|nr:GtrA family protein [Actinomycetota bacterium]